MIDLFRENPQPPNLRFNNSYEGALDLLARNLKERGLDLDQIEKISDQSILMLVIGSVRHAIEQYEDILLDLRNKSGGMWQEKYLDETRILEQCFKLEENLDKWLFEARLYGKGNQRMLSIWGIALLRAMKASGLSKKAQEFSDKYFNSKKARFMGKKRKEVFAKQGDNYDSYTKTISILGEGFVLFLEDLSAKEKATEWPWSRYFKAFFLKQDLFKEEFIRIVLQTLKNIYFLTDKKDVNGNFTEGTWFIRLEREKIIKMIDQNPMLALDQSSLDGLDKAYNKTRLAYACAVYSLVRFIKKFSQSKSKNTPDILHNLFYWHNKFDELITEIKKQNQTINENMLKSLPVNFDMEPDSFSETKQ